MALFGGVSSVYVVSSAAIHFLEVAMIRYSSRGICRIFLLINTTPLVLT
jgi:hypothetical protein